MDNQFDPSRQDPQQQQWQQQQWQQQQQQQGHYDQNGQWHPNPQYPGPVEIGFADAIRICFNKYADFKGRAPRAEYWWWVLFTFVVSMATGWIPFLGHIATIALFIPGLAVSWRRLHDIGKSGAWYFLPVVPAILFCSTLVFIFADALLSGHSGFVSSVGLPIWILFGASGIITLVCEILLIVWLAREGEPHPNRFGPNPYGYDDGAAPGQ